MAKGGIGQSTQLHSRKDLRPEKPVKFTAKQIRAMAEGLEREKRKQARLDAALKQKAQEQRQLNTRRLAH